MSNKFIRDYIDDLINALFKEAEEYKNYNPIIEVIDFILERLNDPKFEHFNPPDDTLEYIRKQPWKIT